MYKTAATITLGTLALCGCTSIREMPTSTLASGLFYTANGTPAGTVVIVAAGDEVIINLAAVGLAKGAHGVHLHTTGACDGPGFGSAGAHLNPHGKQHGSANPAGSHLGDLPNLVIAANGAGTIRTKLNDGRAQIATDLFDADGAAVVIHADSDDYKTDPSGNSGTRIACAVLRPAAG